MVVLILKGFYIFMVTRDPHEIMLLVTDAIFMVDFSSREVSGPSLMSPLHPAANFLIRRLLSSTSSNGVLSVGCTVGFGGLLFLIVILSGLQDASAVYWNEPWSLATTSPRVFVFMLPFN